jgi:hypothetical protein
MMDDIELLKLELKAMRLKNRALEDEVVILRRYRKLVERSTQIAAGVAVEDKALTDFLLAGR